jgi:hypothetical protein
MSQRLVALLEQLFGALKAASRSHSDAEIGRLRPWTREKNGSGSGMRSKPAGECQVTFQIGSDVIEHTRQSASIKVPRSETVWSVIPSLCR